MSDDVDPDEIRPDGHYHVDRDADGFYVEDTGLGIPEDKQQAVFEAGYSTAKDGTGFGLTIVTEVAQAHGWSVRVADGPKDGARFEITNVEFIAE